jgi:hypothetical protein
VLGLGNRVIDMLKRPGSPSALIAHSLLELSTRGAQVLDCAVHVRSARKAELNSRVAIDGKIAPVVVNVLIAPV